MQDLVSIISPSYNCGKYIYDTICSVQGQSYVNWELLVVDDCSNDNTVDTVNCFQDNRIRLIRNDRNRGAAYSRNIALKEAKGRWIAFLDCDDLWEPAKLEKQIKFMEDNGYAFSYTEYSEMDADGVLTGVRISGPTKITRSGMFAFCWPGCLTVMYDATKVGLIQIEDIKKNNDYAMWLKVCKKADCYLLPEVLAIYRRGRMGSISSHGISTMIKWHFKLFREAEKMGLISSLWHVGVNLVCGLYKKIKYVSREGKVS